MRPIDADKILEIHELETKLIGKDWTINDLVAAIEYAPTISAIPVEWLEEHDGENISDSNENIYGRRYITISEALSMWKKEQEMK